MRPLRRTDRPPAHDAVNIGPWPRPGSRCQRRALFVCQDRRLSGRLACHQCLRAAGIEAQHPVPDHRQAHAAGSRGLAAGPAVGDHRKGRKPPRLIRILAPARCATQVIARKVRSRLNSRSRRKPPLFSMVNHAEHRLANPHRRACVSKPQYQTVREVATPEGVLHFKTDCLLLDAETILPTKRLAVSGCFEGYRVLHTADG